jgi:hypothetical protein
MHDEDMPAKRHAGDFDHFTFPPHHGWTIAGNGQHTGANLPLPAESEST